MYNDAGAWHAMMSLISRALIKYLNAQIEAGAQVVQLFDSWVGCLGPADYVTYVLPYTRNVIAGIKPGIPVIHFGTGTASLLEAMREAGGNVIGLDWRVPLDQGWDRVGRNFGIMGNLDPVALFADQKRIREQARQILAQAAGRPGHTCNLGHGMLPSTPVANVLALVNDVHERSSGDWCSPIAPAIDSPFLQSIVPLFSTSHLNDYCLWRVPHAEVLPQLNFLAVLILMIIGVGQPRGRAALDKPPSIPHASSTVSRSIVIVF